MRSIFERLPLAGALFVLCGSLLPAAAHADWRQVNEDGFGAIGANSTCAMVAFDGRLFAATGHPGRLFRTDGIEDPATGRFVWEPVTLPTNLNGVELEITDIRALAAFGTPETRSLYMAVSGNDSLTGEYKDTILRSDATGGAWSLSSDVWSSRSDGEVAALAVFGGRLYATMGAISWPLSPTAPPMRILRTDGSGWEDVTPDITLGTGDLYFGDLQVFRDHLYAGTSGPNEIPAGDRTAEVWRTADGVTWERVGELSSPTMAEVESMAVFRNRLYVGTKNHPVGIPGTGPELWRTLDGTAWELVPTVGQFHPHRLHLDTLQVLGHALFAGIGGGDLPQPMASVYRSFDGTSWDDITPSLLGGDAENYLVGAMAEAWGDLFVATGFNRDAGTEVWRHRPEVVPSSAVPEEEIPKPFLSDALFLIGCGPCPACLGRACDPRINPDGNYYVIWDPRYQTGETISRRKLGLGPEDGPLAAGAPVVAGDGTLHFVVSVPGADRGGSDAGALIYFDHDDNVILRIDGTSVGERLGSDMDVRGDEVAVVSTRRLLRLRGGKIVAEHALGSDLAPQRGIYVAFTADHDQDGRPDLLVGAPHAAVGELVSAGRIQVVGSRSGKVIDEVHGSMAGQRLGRVLPVFGLRDTRFVVFGNRLGQRLERED